jgi:serine/threonine protein kinase
MGEVYKALDTRLNRTVAIKVLPAQLASDIQFRDRFDHEARTISQLDHPHICALYDVGEEQGTSFLVMQYLEGETLADRLNRGPVPLDEALRYFDTNVITSGLGTRYDVTPDGQRFILNLNSAAATAIPPIRVVLNWATGLKQ